MKRCTLQSGDSTPAALFKILTRLQSLILLLLLKKRGKVKEVEKPPLEFTDVSTSVSIHLFQQHMAAESFIRRTQTVQEGEEDPGVPHIIRCKMNETKKTTFDYVTIMGQLFITVAAN